MRKKVTCRALGVAKAFGLQDFNHQMCTIVEQDFNHQMCTIVGQDFNHQMWTIVDEGTL